jgi:hypothetical protein
MGGHSYVTALRPLCWRRNKVKGQRGASLDWSCMILRYYGDAWAPVTVCWNCRLLRGYIYQPCPILCFGRVVYCRAGIRIRCGDATYHSGGCLPSMATYTLLCGRSAVGAAVGHAMRALYCRWSFRHVYVDRRTRTGSI